MQQRVQRTKGFYGHCLNCDNNHSLGPGNSVKYCIELMNYLEKSGTLAHSTSPIIEKGRFSTETLFGPARGKMFGVMECVSPDGTITVLKAFSGQFSSSWLIDGWCPPLFDVSAFERLTYSTEKTIKQLGVIMSNQTVGSPTYVSCKRQRKKLSQILMRDIHDLYEFNNFKDEKFRLTKVLGEGKGISTGTGDCCGPKMLNFAAKNNLRPLGMSEFYWGKDNPSSTRQHGEFYPPCKDKCQPILGTMLCGL